MAQTPINRRKNISAQVHRFGDAVAVYLGTGETVYLTPQEARKFTRAINRAARSCERESFVDSTCGTVNFTFDPA